MTPDTQLLSAEAALDLVAELLARHPIAGARVDVHRGDSIGVDIQRGGAVRCHLSVGFDSGRRVPVTGRRSGEIVDHAWCQTPRVMVTWSSAERSVAQAVAALGLYREVVELAALVEARLANDVVGWSESAESAARP